MKIKFYWGGSEKNYHGTEAKGEKWNQKPRTGPKLIHLLLDVHPPSTGHSFIYYFPSGAWWYFDIYIDRRALAPVSDSDDQNILERS